MNLFVLTPRAEQDISDIWDYIADDNIKAANRDLDTLENAIIRLAKNPGMGHWREELADKRHRFLLVYSYLIVYRYETKRCRSFAFYMLVRDVQSLGPLAG
jgi:toxin ParE1/3/4